MQGVKEKELRRISGSKRDEVREKMHGDKLYNWKIDKKSHNWACELAHDGVGWKLWHEQRKVHSLPNKAPSVSRDKLVPLLI